ncbi:MAG TPA: hypothetical protein GXZ64_04065 [Clostridiaceae bacterium]|nr:hypothetical protein [Clostridiaceae bacterium]
MTESKMVGIDGKYRWLYEQNLINNPKRFFLFWRIGIILSVLAAFYTGYYHGRAEEARAVTILRTGAYVFVIMTAVLLILCLILKKIGIGTRLLLYQMDDDSLHIITLKKYVSKYDVQKTLAVMTGQMKGDPRAADSQLFTDVRSTEKVKYHAISTVSYRRFWRQIRIKSGLRVFNVFARRHQAEFVLNTIFARSAKARMARQEKKPAK